MTNTQPRTPSQKDLMAECGAAINPMTVQTACMQVTLTHKCHICDT